MLHNMARYTAYFPRCAMLHNAENKTAYMELQPQSCRIVRCCTTRHIRAVILRVMWSYTTRRIRGLTCRVVQHCTPRQDWRVEDASNVRLIIQEVKARMAGIMVYSAYIQLVLVRRWADYMHHEHSHLVWWFSSAVIVYHCEWLSIVEVAGSNPAPAAFMSTYWYSKVCQMNIHGAFIFSEHVKYYIHNYLLSTLPDRWCIGWSAANSLVSLQVRLPVMPVLASAYILRMGLRRLYLGLGWSGGRWYSMRCQEQHMLMYPIIPMSSRPSRPKMWRLWVQSRD